MAKPTTAVFVRGAAAAVRRRALAAVAVLLAFLVTACSGVRAPEPSARRPDDKPSASALPPLPASLTAQRLAWRACAAPSRAQGGNGKAPRPLADGSRWECSTLKVPLDYARWGPGADRGATIGLALIRVRSTAAPGRRLGSLVFNFGGPGGSGVASLPGWAATFERLRSRYDLVSFDPRGVGASAGVRCRTDRELEAASLLDASPDTAREERAFMADAIAYGAGCARRSGRVLPHVGTASAARDLDVLRQALGDARLSYTGFSYGTELGAVYAHLFPKKVGRVVLDAAVDPTADAFGRALHQTTGFQRALNGFLADCARKGRACPVGGGPKEGTRKVAAFLDRLDRRPLPTRSKRPLTQTRALNGIVLPLYNKGSWPALRTALHEALARGSGDRLLALADSFNDRDRHGRYSTAGQSQRAISCADTRQRPTVAEVRARLPRFRAVSPVFGPFMAWDLAGWCARWPVPGAWHTPQVGAPGAAPVLVVGTTGDPATPYEGAARLARELGPGVGVHLTYRGEGHGAYPSGDRCVTGVVNGYLLAGRVPANNTICPRSARSNTDPQVKRR